MKVGLFLLLGSLFVFSGSAAWAGACDDDMQQYCSDVQPGAGALESCIHNNFDKFSYQCKEQFKKVSNSVKRLGDACMDDARAYCRDVRPGYGRVKQCILANRDKLSPACVDALKAAGL